MYPLESAEMLEGKAIDYLDDPHQCLLIILNCCDNRWSNKIFLSFFFMGSYFYIFIEFFILNIIRIDISCSSVILMYENFLERCSSTPQVF